MVSVEPNDVPTVVMFNSVKNWPEASCANTEVDFASFSGRI